MSDFFPCIRIEVSMCFPVLPLISRQQKSHWALIFIALRASPSCIVGANPGAGLVDQDFAADSARGGFNLLHFFCGQCYSGNVPSPRGTEHINGRRMANKPLYQSFKSYKMRH